MGYGDVDVSTTDEYILTMIGMLLGALCFALLTAMVSTWVTYGDVAGRRLGKKLQTMNSFYKRVDVPEATKSRVTRFF